MDATCFPAISKPVPWSTLVLMKGNPIVVLTPLSKPFSLNGIKAWSWYRAKIILFSGIFLALRRELKTQCNIYAKIALQPRQDQGMVMVWGIIMPGSCVIFQ